MANNTDEELSSNELRVTEQVHLEDKAESFADLYSQPIEKYVKEKRGDYLPWSMSWALFKHLRPDASYVYERDRVFDSGEVEVVVTVTTGGQSMQSILPVLDPSNKPIKNPNRFAVNTARQRCLTKAIAMHGLGLTCWNWVAVEEINNFGESVEKTDESLEETSYRPPKRPKKKTASKKSKKKQDKVGAELWEKLDQIEQSLTNPEVSTEFNLSTVEREIEATDKTVQELLKPKLEGVFRLLTDFPPPEENHDKA